MPKITKIVSGKSNPNRVNVFIDGKFRFSTDKLSWIKHNLQIEQNISEGMCKKLADEGALSKAYDKALKLLSYRPQSEQEIKIKLSKHFDRDTVRLTLGRLSDNGLLDDLTFAISWIKERLRTRRRSVRHLTAELAHKGIPRNYIDEALKVTGARSEEVSIARDLIAQKIRGSSDQVALTKAKAYLSRKGFPYSTVVEAVKQIKR